MVDPLRAIASDLSFEVLQRRARFAELRTPQLDSSNQRLHPLALPYRSFIADPEFGQPEEPELSETPTLQRVIYPGRKGRG